MIWKIYIIEETFLVICQIKLININKFAKTILDENINAFKVYIGSLAAKMTMYLVRQDGYFYYLLKKLSFRPNT